MVHRPFPYAPCINTSQPSYLVYTCNNPSLLKLHKIKCNVVNVFFILTKKPLTKNALLTSLSWTFKPAPPYIFFSDENRFFGAVADNGTTASELKTPPFQKQKTNYIFNNPFLPTSHFRNCFSKTNSKQV